MTFFHFGNCLALTYGPVFLLYRYSGVTEYGAFWKCFQVAGVYVVTQLCKMLILATFFPPLDGPASPLFNIMKSTVDFGDLIGLSIVIARKGPFSYSFDSGHIKILIIGVGWAAADLILTRALPLFVGARGLQFDWKYILMSLEANIALINHVTTALLIWLWWRANLSSYFRPVVAWFLVFSVYRQILPLIITEVLKIKYNGFNLLLISAIPTIMMSIASLQMYIYHTHKSKAA